MMAMTVNHAGCMLLPAQPLSRIHRKREGDPARNQQALASILSVWALSCKQKSIFERRKRWEWLLLGVVAALWAPSLN